MHAIAITANKGTYRKYFKDDETYKKFYEMLCDIMLITQTVGLIGLACRVDTRERGRPMCRLVQDTQDSISEGKMLGLAKTRA